MFDGEISNSILFNRIIGLFKVDTFLDKLKDGEVLPDRIFFDGRERDVKDLLTIIDNEYLPPIKQMRTEDESDFFEKCSEKFNLCPITYSIIKRYIDFRENINKKTLVESKSKFKDFENIDWNFQIFVSYKSEDFQSAQWLYHYLTEKGYQVFCSGETLSKMGESDYAHAIDKALDKARCLIVFGTNAEYFDAGWVGYEWRSFLNEIHSGRKKNGKVFTFSHNVAIDELPYALRSVQNIPFSPSSPQDSFENLYQYIIPVLE